MRGKRKSLHGFLWLSRGVGGVLLFLSVSTGIAESLKIKPPQERGALSGAMVESLLTIQSQQDVHHFKVEVAKTNEEQERGLMFRHNLPLDQGMLFVFPVDQYIHLWMKNTYIPLDMVFIRRDGKIDEILPQAEPLSLRVLSSQRPVAAVLEINAGQAEKLGLKEGDMTYVAPFLP